jgi:hypothetical protein
MISPPENGKLRSTPVSEPVVSVTLPGERYLGVARLVTAGVAARLDLPFEAVDDLQLAVELVLAGAFAADQEPTVAFATDGRLLTVAIMPVEENTLATTRAAYAGGESLTLGKLLERLVDGVVAEAEPVPALILQKALEVSRP